MSLEIKSWVLYSGDFPENNMGADDKVSEKMIIGIKVLKGTVKEKWNGV